MLRRYVWPLGLLAFAGTCAITTWSLYSTNPQWALVASALAQLAAYPGLLWVLLLSLGPKGGLRGLERPLAVGFCLTTFIAVAYGLPGPAMGVLMIIAQGANDAGRRWPEQGPVIKAALTASAILLSLAALLALRRTHVRQRPG